MYKARFSPMFQFYLSSIKSNIHNSEHNQRAFGGARRAGSGCAGNRANWPGGDFSNSFAEEGFNSTLVQLKAYLLLYFYNALLCFNSTLVQLKDKQPDLRNPVQMCFNSTLVQLKA